MHRKDKSRQRSVAIQSTDLSDAEIEVGFLTNRLCKKAGFRNLLRKSVIIVSQENEKEKENVCLTEGKTSRSVQASLDRCGPVQKLPFTGNRSLEFTGSKGAVSEMLKVFDRGTGSANPGTSRMTSAIFSSYSMISQVC